MDSRQAFELWMKHMMPRYERARRGDGYLYHPTENLWQAWQGCDMWRWNAKDGPESLEKFKAMLVGGNTLPSAAEMDEPATVPPTSDHAQTRSKESGKGEGDRGLWKCNECGRVTESSAIRKAHIHNAPPPFHSRKCDGQFERVEDATAPHTKNLRDTFTNPESSPTDKLHAIHALADMGKKGSKENPWESVEEHNEYMAKCDVTREEVTHLWETISEMEWRIDGLSKSLNVHVGNPTAHSVNLGTAGKRSTEPEHAPNVKVGPNAELIGEQIITVQAIAARAEDWDWEHEQFEDTFPGNNLARGLGDRYIDSTVQCMWLGWQARAKLAKESK